jgi:hypothetical protein
VLVLKSQDRHGPIPLRNGTDDRLELMRASETCGIGRTVFGRMRLPPSPGPHQRSISLALKFQLPQRMRISEPSNRGRLPSRGAKASVAEAVVDRRSFVGPPTVRNPPASRASVP